MYNTLNMIIVKKTGYLKYKNFRFRCAFGMGGIKKKTKEGDNITPKGIFKITRIYYRPDRIKKIIVPIKTIKIKKKIGWCDDPKSNYYNKQIKLPTKFSHEKLYRKDKVYDLIAVLNYNSDPIIKNKGSAIFMHIATDSYKQTKGCIALKKDDLIKIISLIKKSTQIRITNN
jgi:L,D-peptidoglycan transpeptidase YkuD (ErfK/YbiS/YcfS/YnhG family)